MMQRRYFLARSMKPSIIFLILCSLGFYGQANDCTIPKPFKPITADASQRYNFYTITGLEKQAVPEKQALPEKQTDPAKQIDLKTIKIVNFWASWCPPCREELPLLDTLAKEKRANIHLLNLGDLPQVAEKTLENLKIRNLTSQNIDYDILSQLKIPGLPATLLWHNEQSFLALGKINNEKQMIDWLTCLKK